MKAMKYFLTLCFLALTATAFGQGKVWTEPAADIDPADTLKIYVDLTKMDCDKLVGSAGPLYIWSWLPADPAVGNGTWDNSNDLLQWTNMGNDIWRFTMIPTDFYNVSAQDVYDNDIHFLVKGKDGGSGGDCSAAGSENKTEDLTVAVDPPVSPQLKVVSFPAASDGDSIRITELDFFSLRYDNTAEEKVSMQNATDLYVYARAYDMNGNEYRPSPLSQVGSNPKLQMTNDGDGQWRWTIQPKKLFSIPDTESLDYVRLQIMKPVVQNSDDAVDGEYIYYIRCN